MALRFSTYVRRPCMIVVWSRCISRPICGSDRRESRQHQYMTAWRASTTRFSRRSDSTSFGVRPNQLASSKVLRAAALAGTRSTRLGTPDDIAAMVVHLLSDDGAWINGQVSDPLNYL